MLLLPLLFDYDYYWFDLYSHTGTGIFTITISSTITTTFATIVNVASVHIRVILTFAIPIAVIATMITMRITIASTAIYDC